MAHDVSAVELVVPTTQRWVVRTITLFYPGSLGDSYFQAVDQATNATWWKDEEGALSGASFVYATDLRIVLREGSIQQLTGGGGPDVTLSGYAFTLP